MGVWDDDEWIFLNPGFFGGEVYQKSDQLISIANKMTLYQNLTVAFMGKKQIPDDH